MPRKIFSKPIILSLLIIGLLIFANRFGWLDYTQKYFFHVTNPVQKGFYAASLTTHNFFSFLSSLGSLKEENERLKEENQEFWGEVVRLMEMLKKKNFYADN